MEHALRRHISERRASDPVYYESISERLERILEQLSHEHEEKARALERLIHDMREADAAPQSEDGLDPMTERPIRNLLEAQMRSWLAGHQGLTETGVARIDVQLVRDLVGLVRREASPPHFPESTVLQDRLRRRVRNHLVRGRIFDADTATVVAEQLLGVVRSNWRHFRESVT